MCPTLESGRSQKRRGRGRGDDNNRTPAAPPSPLPANSRHRRQPRRETLPRPRSGRLGYHAVVRSLMHTDNLASWTIDACGERQAQPPNLTTARRHTAHRLRRRLLSLSATVGPGSCRHWNLCFVALTSVPDGNVGAVSKLMLILEPKVDESRRPPPSQQPTCLPSGLPTG